MAAFYRRLGPRVHLRCARREGSHLDDDRSRADLRTIIIAFLANVGIAVAKAVAFLATGSAALLAETFHSVADTTNQGLLLVGWRLGRRRPDPEHPFGYGRERYFWPFVYAVLVFAVGAVAALWRGWRQLVDPEPITEPIWAFVVLGVALVLDGTSFANALRQADRRRSGSYWQFVRVTRDPEIPVVLLEDAAGVTGVAIAAAAIGLAVATGNTIFDAVGSLLIGAVLVAVAYVLAQEMRSLLIGEPATPDEERAIRAVFEEHPDVRELVSLRTMHLGPGEVLVDSKVRLQPTLDSDAIAHVIDDIEATIRQRVPGARFIAVEPDLAEPGDPDAPDFARETGSHGPPPDRPNP